ncbi:MAG: 2-dehydropantoate 2-reductase [Candidatus Acidiferrales bacterium]|jgi:2-dehydropantoate 2-reductase
MPTPAETNSVPAKKRVAVMGAGAVGSYFGGMLARAGVPVMMIARPSYVEAVRRNKLLLDTVTFQERVAVEASTDPSALRDAHVVLFCVKGQDDEETARAIAPYLAADAIVVSLQNGVDNVERIRAASGVDALPAVVYVAAAMPEPGHVKHSGRGELIVGEFAGRSASAELQPPRAEQIAALFASANVPCRISADILADMWLKFITNCGANAVSAIAQASYGEIARYDESRELMSRVVEESIAVGRAAGVSMPGADFTEKWLENLAKFGDAFSSTAQDLERGKRTEIESLNGYIVRRGAELGVATPSNFALYALVKLLEDKAASEKQARPAGAAQ